jgi:hypothetical protein
VASSAFALSLVPGDITMTAEPGGSAALRTVEVRNVGATGTINWTAAADASWIGLSPTSGSAGNSTPGTLEVTADPTGLDVGTYTGFVSVSGNAANSPAEIRVRLAVAERIPLDAAVTTAGFLPYGQRLRYLVSGTAGQEIDVAVLVDGSQSLPLADPVLRLYGPDGETLLAWNDDAFDAGLGLQSLLYRVLLPEDGDYLVEVGSSGDASEGGFLLKARPAGPILGVYPFATIADRLAQDGDPAVTTLYVYNLSGVGSLSWTLTCADSWISCSPTSGVLSLAARPVAPRELESPKPETSALPPGRPDRRGEAIRAELQQILFRGQPAPQEKLAQLSQATILASARGGKPTAPFGDPQVETPVTVTLDPTGLSLESNWGSLIFQTADGWLPGLLVQAFAWVYSAGMAIAGEEYGYGSPWELTTDDTRPGDPPAIGVAFDYSGSLLPISSDATVGAPLVSGLGNPVGVTLGDDANWYVSSWYGSQILRVTRNGDVAPFASVAGDWAAWLAWGPEGELYATPWSGTQILKVNPDGSVVTFGPDLSDWGTGLAYRPQDNSLYVGLWNGSGLLVMPLEDPTDTRTLATNVFVTGVAVGHSGTVYLSDWSGRVWSLDPDAASEGTLLAVSPSWYELMGAALLDGGLALSGFSFGEFYRFTIDDNPIPHPAEELAQYVAYLDLEQIDAVQGEAFDVPLVVESTDGSDLPVAAYVNRLGWQPADVTYLGNAAGDFGGTYVPNDTDADQGIFRAAAARATAVGVPSTTLFSLTYNASLEPGQCTDISIQFDELSGPAGENYLPQLEVVSPASIGLSEAMGDVTGDGTVAAADAVQILRWLVGLPICDGCDISRGDANCDGSIQASDAVVILRWLVGLPVGDACVGIPRIGPCPAGSGEASTRNGNRRP